MPKLFNGRKVEWIEEDNVMWLSAKKLTMSSKFLHKIQEKEIIPQRVQPPHVSCFPASIEVQKLRILENLRRPCRSKKKVKKEIHAKRRACTNSGTSRDLSEKGWLTFQFLVPLHRPEPSSWLLPRSACRMVRRIITDAVRGRRGRATAVAVPGQRAIRARRAGAVRRVVAVRGRGREVVRRGRRTHAAERRWPTVRVERGRGWLHVLGRRWGRHEGTQRRRRQHVVRRHGRRVADVQRRRRRQLAVAL